MFCKISLKHGKKNAITWKFKTFKTRAMMQHEQLIDHTHDVSAGELSANFEAAVSKALCQEDEVTLVIWQQQKKRLLKPSHSVSHTLTKGV